MELTNFINQITDFYSLTSSNKIPYLFYFLQVEQNIESVKSKHITDCCEILNINCHSNVHSYLSNFSAKGKKQLYLKKKDGGYVLLSTSKESISKKFVQKNIILNPTNELYPLDIFENTRDYLKAFAQEASCCYDTGLYNSCLFMIRKIIETLIIELYESKGMESKIKNPNNDFYQLADLIRLATNENSWKFSKIVKENLPKIKLLADSSVHSKRFKARKTDIENMKTDVRISFEELIHHIDYKSWYAKL